GAGAARRGRPPRGCLAERRLEAAAGGQGAPVRGLLAGVVAALLLTVAVPAAAQRGAGGRGRPPSGAGGSSQEPHAPTPEEEEELHNAYQRASEPEITPPKDPLE